MGRTQEIRGNTAPKDVFVCPDWNSVTRLLFKWAPPYKAVSLYDARGTSPIAREYLLLRQFCVVLQRRACVVIVVVSNRCSGSRCSTAVRRFGDGFVLRSRSWAALPM